MDKNDWNSKAANLIKAELKLAGIGYEELVLRLAGIGVQETYKGIASKINRGTFSFVFFMQCIRHSAANLGINYLIESTE